MIYYTKGMDKKNFQTPVSWFHCIVGIIGMFALFFCPVNLLAQQPTATIMSLGGEVMVSIQKGALASGMVGNVLRAGDEIRTHAGAIVGMAFSDGSQAELGENTNISLSAMAEAPQTGTRTVRLDLWRGRIRLSLSSGVQSPGSSFSIQTHNALVVTLSSPSDSEIVYDPNTNKTTILAHKAAVIVTNLLTGISTQIPEGHSGIIRDRVIQEIARIVQLPSLTELKQPTATIRELREPVFVSIQGEAPTPAILQTVLRTGDDIRTYSGAGVTLTLSEGSELKLGENTTINLSSLVEDAQTGTRISRFELWQGSLRSILSAEHQKPGSSFTVQTPNALVGVISSEPDSEVMYDVSSNTTIVNAHKSEVVVTNLLTGSSKVIPQGHSGIIQQRVIQELARIVASPAEILTLPAESPETPAKEQQETEETPKEPEKKKTN
ncbi:Fe2+-dicitrate sensor [Candidatus Vecturithrix granuli]|uniref:Fe2+-dicitrate sensor n=1 Tax=Vecturithrix granuli TaxID=1499967 RepID=A0A081BXJ3_VECG1|nr:Fe2+-dicitrate sensor [Candidatus Vecturithrix granuli]